MLQLPSNGAVHYLGHRMTGPVEMLKAVSPLAVLRAQFV
jgi:hypothetical protein